MALHLQVQNFSSQNSGEGPGLWEGGRWSVEKWEEIFVNLSFKSVPPPSCPSPDLVDPHSPPILQWQPKGSFQSTHLIPSLPC